jgi:hypothetical protein
MAFRQVRVSQFNHASASGPPPNPRLQRTPSASPPSPLSRKPLGDTRDGKCGVEISPSRAPRQVAHGGIRDTVALTLGRGGLVKFCSSPNNSLHRTPSAAPPSPVSSKPLGNARSLQAEDAA